MVLRYKGQRLERNMSEESLCLSNSLMGSFRKGSLQKAFCKMSTKFSQTSALFTGAINHSFAKNYTNVPQNFRAKLSAQSPSLTGPIGESLSVRPLLMQSAGEEAAKEVTEILTDFDRTEGRLKIWAGQGDGETGIRRSDPPNTWICDSFVF